MRENSLEAKREDLDEPRLSGPIMAISGPLNSLGDVERAQLLKAQTEEVNWMRGPQNPEQVGDKKYVMSSLNMKHKSSEGYIVCNGIAAIGQALEGKRNESVLTHQIPQVVLPGSDSNFAEDLKRHLRDLISKTKDGTRDYVIFGGRLYRDQITAGEPGRDFYNRQYEAATDRLKALVLEITGTAPRVVALPNDVNEQIDVFLDTRHRQLYITYGSASIAI